MKVTQTIELSSEERLAIQKVLGLCDEISDISHTSMIDVFSYLVDIANIVDKHKYLMPDMLHIAEIG